MGLDMYLYGEMYKFDGESSSHEIKLEEVGYWRKQNAIHNWMVNNVQNGVDNCAMYELTKDTLKTLLMACKDVLNNPTVENAMEMLPTREGFFFGGTDLTDKFELEYYLDGLKYTVNMIKRLLKEDKYDYYVYQSSW